MNARRDWPQMVGKTPSQMVVPSGLLLKKYLGNLNNIVVDGQLLLLVFINII